MGGFRHHNVSEMLKFIENVLLVWTGLAYRAGWVGVAALLALTGAAGLYAAANLKVDTDTSAMLDPTLDFQERAATLKDAFPGIKTDVVVIASAPTADEADAFIADLRGRLLNDGTILTDIFAPVADPFFRENGLLYLSESELEARLSQLTRAAGLIETLVASPTAATLFETLEENDRLAAQSDLGTQTLSDLYGELAIVISDAQGSEAAAASRPFSWLGALDTDAGGADRHVRILYGTPQLDYTRLQPAKPALDALSVQIDASLARFGADRVTTFITGDPALRADELSAVTTGIGKSFAISLALVSVLLVIAFRSLTLSVMTLVSLVMSITLTAAFAALTVGQLNLVSVAFTVLLVGLGLDFAIHLLLHVQAHRRNTEPTALALKGAVHEVGAALSLAAPTTAIGFFAFVPTRFDGIAQLGIIAGAGVIIAFLVAVTFLPAALGAFANNRKSVGEAAAASDGDAARSAVTAKAGAANRIMNALSGPLAIVTIIGGLGSLMFLPVARFDADPMALRDPASQSVRGFDQLFSDPDTLPYRLTRLVSTREEAVETAARARAIEGVGGVRSLVNFIPADQDAKLELIDFAAGSLIFAFDAGSDYGETSNDGVGETPDDPSSNENTGPESTALSDAARALADRLDAGYSDASRDHPAARLAPLLRAMARDPALAGRAEEAIFRYWPDLVARLSDQLQADYIDEGTLPETLVRRYRSGNSAGDNIWRVDILPEDDLRDHAALTRFVDRVEAEFPDIGGGAIQSLKAGQVIARSMLTASTIAFAIISVFLWILMRRLSDIAILLFPLFLAASLTTAAGVIFNIPFNYANVIVLPLLLGIGVDSGIHLVMRQRQMSDRDTLYGTSTPRAVLFSALTTVASFGSLMISAHRGTASMGQLLSIAIAFTLLCTLIVLPALLRWRDRRPATARRVSEG